MARGQENPKRIDRTNVAAGCREGAKPIPSEGKARADPQPLSGWIRLAKKSSADIGLSGEFEVSRKL